MSESHDMTITEEFLLLLLRDETGFLASVPEWRMSCSLVGATLLDLSFHQRIDTDMDSVSVMDAEPTGDGLLDPTLATIASESTSRGPRYWVERLAANADDVNEMALERLVQRGILEHDAAGFWSRAGRITRSGLYPAENAGEEVRYRVMRVLFDNELPDPRDCALVALVQACEGFKALLTTEEYEEAEQRIDLIAGLDIFGRAVLAAVRSSYSPPARLQGPRQALPVVNLWDCLKSSTLRAGNLPKFFAEQAERLGPAYRVEAPKTSFVVLAGAEMNHWVGRKGRLHLRSRDYLEDFQAAWGTARSIASMDGAEHYRMRKSMRAGTARAVVEDRLPELFELGRASMREWVGDGGARESQPGEAACQRMLGRQIARLTTSIDPSDQLIDGLLAFEFRALLVYVMGLLPAITLRTPAMRRAHKAVLDTYARIHSSHSPAQREHASRDIVDDLMDLHDGDPQFLPETDLEFAFIAPLIAGHYCGSAMSFALYELLAHPDLARRIAAEADALFAAGDPTGASFSMDAIDVTHRFVMENLRLHPVIPVHNRTAANSFDVDGKLVPARTTVMVAYPAAHFMAENFPDPDRFDIDRFLPPRNEHRKLGAYQPFGIGTHTCLGQRFTELAMVADLLLIAHHVELEMVPANYRLKISPVPKFSPDKRFRFRVKRVRHPIPTPS